ncbi:MAG: ABC transporter ATP-binding protein, partial [Pontixanthobacter sp.]
LEIGKIEKRMNALRKDRDTIDRALSDPDTAAKRFAAMSHDALLSQRAEYADQLDAVELEWLALGEELETLGAA